MRLAGQTAAHARLPATPSPYAAFIAGLPKAELHVHHVGSASPADRRRARRAAPRHRCPRDPDELRDVLRRSATSRTSSRSTSRSSTCSATPEDVRLLTYEVAREMAGASSVRYAELTCTPYTSVRARGIPIEAYTEAIEDARVAAERDFGIVLRWIYDIPGECGLPAADATLRLRPRPPRPTRWSASGSAGPRSACRGRSSSRTSTPARAAGLHSVPHAGETTGPQTVWDALRAARRRADRPRHLVGAGPGAARAPRRAPASRSRSARPPTSPPARSTRSTSTRSRQFRDAGVTRHGQLRRPADVRHHAQPGVRDRRRPARPRRGGRRRPGEERRATRRSCPTPTRRALAAEIDAYASGA